MKSLLLCLLLLSSGLPGWHWLVRVREQNTAQARARAALQARRPAEAAYYFQQAVALTGRGSPNPTLLLSLGQAQQQASQLEAARATYGRLLAPAVPATIGSVARQQLASLLVQQRQVAQAVGLLRQALRLNPANATARYNYELLSQYLAGQQPDNPALPPPAAASPAPARQPHRPDSTQRDKQSNRPQPAEKAGTDRPGQAPDPSPASTAGPASAPRPSTAGQPDRQRPTSTTGSSATGGFRPGVGERQPLPSGTAPGSQRGLDASAGASGPGAPTSQGRRPGTEAATNADLQLQTQRERLKAMNLTPAQAQQVLEALRASEQQYLQQRPRQQPGPPPAPGQPTW